MLNPETVRHLSDVTGVPVEALRAATLEALDPEHRLAPLTTGDRYTHRRVLASGWVRLHGTQLCPVCISETSTWMVRWRIPLVTACTVHHVYLVHECPSCKRPFRDGRHSALRVDTDPFSCGNPVGAGPKEQCHQDLRQLIPCAADRDVVSMQVRVDAALSGGEVHVLGRPSPAGTYLPDLRALASLILHLGMQPGAGALAPWTRDLMSEAKIRERERGPRWAIAPPRTTRVRAGALSAADHVFRSPDTEMATVRLAAWLDLTPTTNESRMGWWADHTQLTPGVGQLLLATDAPRGGLSRRLDAGPALVPMHAIPQLLGTDLYANYFKHLLNCTDDIGRMFASLLLARTHGRNRTWEDAADSLGIPRELGFRTVRAAHQRRRADPEALHAASRSVALLMDRTISWRLHESRVRDLSKTLPDWLEDWAHTHRPGMRESSAPYAITWRWIHEAGGAMVTSPAWSEPPSRIQRAAYRQFASGVHAYRAPRPCAGSSDKAR